MDSKVQAVLDEYHARMERELAMMRTRYEKACRQTRTQRAIS
jgi:hypothetical protein